jgi:type IV secretion system protein TrbF
MLKKKKPVSGPVKPVSGLAHPYLNARRTWNSHVGSLIASRTLWQATALISLLIALAAVGGVVYIGSQSKFVPYVVEVNKLGEPMAVAPASLAAKVDQPWPSSSPTLASCRLTSRCSAGPSSSCTR